MSKPGYNLIVCILILAVGFLAYSNSFRGEFVFDDLPSIVQNSANKNIGNITAIWVQYPFRFLTNLSFSVNYLLSDLDVVSYHLFNFLVHITAGIILFFLVKNLIYSVEFCSNRLDNFLQKAIPVSAALLFITHPVQTQAVSYITQRASSMAALFYLSTLLCFVKYLNTRKFSFLIASLFLELCAFYTKENTYTLPLAVLLLTYFMNEEKIASLKKKIIIVLPYFTAAVLVYLLQIYFLIKINIYPSTFTYKVVQYPVTYALNSSSNTWRNYLLTQINVIRTYIRLLILPVNQNLDYDYPVSKTIFNFHTIFSLSLISALLISAKIWKRKNTLVSFGILFFFLTLTVETVIPVNDLVNEHRLYLPSVGFFITIMGIMEIIYLFFQKKISQYFAQMLWLVCISITIIFYSFATYKRNLVWQSGYTLWADAISKSPNKARPHFNLGVAYHFQGKSNKAIAEFNNAVKLSPFYTDAQIYLGLENMQTGEKKLAEEAFQRAISINPKNDFPMIKLADLLVSENKIDDAMNIYKKTSIYDISNKAKEYNLRGIILTKQKKFDEARSKFNEALRIDPNLPDAYYNLGSMNLSYGDQDKAILDYNKVLSLDPNNISTLMDLGTIYLSRNESIQALDLFQKVISIDPNNFFAYYYRGISYKYLGKIDLFIKNLKTAIVLKPDFTPAYLALGEIYNKLGQKTDAMEQFRYVLMLDPKNEQAKSDYDRLNSHNLSIDDNITY